MKKLTTDIEHLTSAESLLDAAINELKTASIRNKNEYFRKEIIACKEGIDRWRASVKAIKEIILQNESL